MNRRAAPRRSRRGFLQVLAAGSAAALIAPIQTLAQTAAPKTPLRRSRATPPRQEAPAGRRTASAAEVKKLKGYVDDTLKAIRAYPLPAGSPPAFAFQPLRARRARGK